MRLDVASWDRLLAECLTKPGVQTPSIAGDARPFRWIDWTTAEWSAEQAFQRLGLARLDFPVDMIGRADGFACPDGIGLNASAANKTRTVAHELAHVLLGHVEPMTSIGDLLDHFLAPQAKTPVREFEADCTAMLVCYALGHNDGVLADCRAYVQMFLEHATDDGNLPTSWERIKSTATRILASGAGDFRGELRVEAAARRQRAAASEKARTTQARTFGAQINWGKR